jgi:hypothetical protein
MTTQTFEIIDGVYVGPNVWEGDLDLRDYKDTLTFLGSLNEVGGYTYLHGCTNLVSLGSLTKVRDGLYLTGCTSLTSLGSLTKIGGALGLDRCTSLVSLGPLKERLDLGGCTSLTSSGPLTKIGGSLYLRDCTSLTSLGSLIKVGGLLDLGGCTNLVHIGPLTEVGRWVHLESGILFLQELQEKIRYYSSLPLHDALNALHIKEVNDVPLFKNILLQTLQGG